MRRCCHHITRVGKRGGRVRVSGIPATKSMRNQNQTAIGVGNRRVMGDTHSELGVRLGRGKLTARVPQADLQILVARVGKLQRAESGRVALPGKDQCGDQSGVGDQC